MNKIDIKNRIEFLRKTIIHHNNLYYNSDSPEITDYEYDMLQRELKKLEFENPEFITENSPTQFVGGVADAKFSPVNHSVKMESLQDAFSFDEIIDFDNKIKSVNPNITYSIEPKIDGLSVSLEYINGKFFKGSTRGDGITGENITENLLTIKSVPKVLKNFNGNIEVRGEVFMSHSSFENLVKNQELNNEKTSKNPRNAAAGSLRQKDSKITAERNLDIFVFNVQKTDGIVFKSHVESLNFLKNIGFNVLPFYNKFNNINDVLTEIKRIGENRGNLEYDIDGAVVKVDEIESRTLLGSTSKFPKWAIAYKYPPEEKQTVLNNIVVNVGRTGVLTPVAVFNPIQLAGTTVSRATLHNEDFIKEKNINIGDTIIVRKAGDIIPEVVSLQKKGENSSYFLLPTICPSCGAKVFKESDEAATRCTNADCPAQLLRHLIHFVSRDAMNIDDLGPAVIEQLINANKLKTPADIYKLTASDISELERSGEKSAENILKSINKSKENDVYRLIFALGIRHIGVKAAKLLAEHFNDVSNIINASFQQINSIDGFGEIMSNSVFEFFSVQKNVDLLNEFIELGINTKCLSEKQSEVFKNKTFVLTGTLPTLTRAEATEIIEKNGGKTSSTVSKKTDFVLVGDDAGSKLTKANNLGITVINEEEFLKMI